MNQLMDALEISLQKLEQGEGIESCLALYPHLAEDLRPMLIAALDARSLGADDLPAPVVRRVKSRVLQHAAEMREHKHQPARSVFPFFPQVSRFMRLGTAAAAILIFAITGGTGLVSASTSALPGDHLYPVKRGWESIRLQFVFDEQERESLESEYEDERFEEINELIAEGRAEKVAFEGTLTEAWTIDGISIRVTPETTVDPQVRPGMIVHIDGVAVPQGYVIATQITVLEPDPLFTPMPSPTEMFSTPMPLIINDDLKAVTAEPSDHEAQDDAEIGEDQGGNDQGSDDQGSGDDNGDDNGGDDQNGEDQREDDSREKRDPGGGEDDHDGEDHGSDETGD